MKFRRSVILSAIALCAALGVTIEAYAQRTDTRQYSCQQIVATVQHYQAVLLTTGPTTYGRFFSYPNRCQAGEKPRKAYAPTTDNPRCFIGYRCIPDLD